MGYHLVIVKTPDSDDEKISQLIKDYIPTAKMETNVAAELSFILPKEHTHRQGSRRATRWCCVTRNHYDLSGFL